MRLPREERIKGMELCAESLQESLTAAMMEPSFYPKQPLEVTHRETHISHLFFVDDLVYKIKKAVRFSFLDYSTLRRRRHFLQEELHLNRRLAPSVYLAVLPISYVSHGWQLGSYAHPVEYALVMRRLPSTRMLDFLLDRGQVTPQMMRSLATKVAGFHAEAAAGKRIRVNGHPQLIRKLWEDNLTDIGPFVGRFFNTDTFEALRDFGERFIARHESLLTRRVRENRIRDVHGDLHCEHVCFAPEGIEIFDCIEFSPWLRRCDVASEVAFLIMDMEFRGAKGLARDFLTTYVEATDDHELPLPLPFYKCYRALVRGKVAGLRSNGFRSEASRYFDLAYCYTWEEFKPFLVIISGLTGSGKSTLARELSRRLGLRVVSSDATRKALGGSSKRQETVPYGEGIYSPAMTERTYAKMAEEAERLILQGEGAILDATFHRRAHRETILGLIAKHKIPFLLIQCRSSEEVLQERLRRRAEEGRDLSDGRWEIYLRQRHAFEPIVEVSPDAYLALDTAGEPAQLLSEAERFLFAVLKKRS